MTTTAQGGEIAFGALEAGLEVDYARFGFRWTGCEEGDVESADIKRLQKRRRSRPRGQTAHRFQQPACVKEYRASTRVAARCKSATASADIRTNQSNVSIW